MSQRILTSLLITGEQGIPPFKVSNNNTLEAFIIDQSGYVFIYHVNKAPVSATYSYLVLDSSGRIDYTDVSHMIGLLALLDQVVLLEPQAQVEHLVHQGQVEPQDQVVPLV